MKLTREGLQQIIGAHTHLQANAFELKSELTILGVSDGNSRSWKTWHHLSGNFLQMRWLQPRRNCLGLLMWADAWQVGVFDASADV